MEEEIIDRKKRDIREKKKGGRIKRARVLSGRELGRGSSQGEN